MKLPTPSPLFLMRLLMPRYLLLSGGAAILFAFSSSAQSQKPAPDKPVEWSNLCANTARELLVVTTESGDTVRGYCVSVQYDEVAMRTVDGKVVRIARGTLKTVLALAVSENRLKALGKGMKTSLRYEVKTTFSPLAPAGLMAIPGTLAWGAVAAPFCILGDLFGGKPSQRVLSLRQ
jgi:hypothetical protein